MNARHHADLLVQDLRFGLRSLRRALPLSLAVVLTLTIGLGMNSVVFSLFNGLLFGAPVSRDPSTFVQIHARVSGEGKREFHGPRTLVTLQEFSDIAATTQTMSMVVASRWVSFALGDQNGPLLRGKLVSCNYLSSHIGPTSMGRGFVEADCASPGGQAVVIFTLRAWIDSSSVTRTSSDARCALTTGHSR
jgi:hypothetical protein